MSGIKYTVEHRGGCVLIIGAVPATAFVVLSGLVPKGAVMSTDVARLCGVTFAFGLPEDLAELKAAEVPAALNRELESRPGISQKAASWLASGERGISSNAIFTTLTGFDAMQGWQNTFGNHPHDVDDFRRCRILLESVPELQPLFPKMAEVSPVWARLVKVWPDVSRMMDIEAPGWRVRGGYRAPRAYAMIQDAIAHGCNMATKTQPT